MDVVLLILFFFMGNCKFDSDGLCMYIDSRYRWLQRWRYMCVYIFENCKEIVIIKIRMVNF